MSDPSPGTGVDPYPSSVALHNSSGDRQTRPDASIKVFRPVVPPKDIENAFPRVGFDTDPVVLDIIAVRRPKFDSNFDPSLSLVIVLRRIRNEVDQEFSYPNAITVCVPQTA